MSEKLPLRIVFNADDAGYSATRDAGIWRCAKLGVVRSVSLMVGGASAATAAAEAASLGLSIGLHINLTEGLPLCSAVDVPTLLNQRGEMLGKFGFRQALAAGRIDLAQVRAEVQAQLSKFMEFTAGRSPSHCDGHQHVHVLPGVDTIVAEESRRCSVFILRLPAAHPASLEEVYDADRRSFYMEVSKQAEAAKVVFNLAGLTCPDAFIGFEIMGDDCTVPRLLASISRVSRPAFCEVMVHPGYVVDTSMPAGCGTGPDDFSLSNQRETEMNCLCDPTLASELAALGVLVTSFAVT